MIPSMSTSHQSIDIAKFSGDKAKHKFVFEKEGKTIEEEKQSDGFIRRTFDSDSPFCLIEKFYPSGVIKEKVFAFNEGSAVGDWYFFDEAGKLIEKRDPDKDYAFKAEDVLAYAKNNNIDLPHGYVTPGWVTTVFREVTEDKKIPVWMITHQTAPEKLEEITLNGKIGEVLSKKSVYYRNH